MTQILNQSFRDWSIQHKFPFTDSSDMTSRDGRRIPLSMFIDITVNPDISGSVRISAITADHIEFSIGQRWTAYASLEDFHGGWIPVMRAGTCVGCVMPNPDDYQYLVGMTAVAPLVFSEGHLVLLPETVKGFCGAGDNITPPPTFNGLQSDTMSFTFGERFSVYGDSVTVDTTPVYEEPTTPVTTITVGHLDAGDTPGSNEFDIQWDGSLTIRAPEWCDTQFLSTDDTVIFHQRGS